MRSLPDPNFPDRESNSAVALSIAFVTTVACIAALAGFMMGVHYR